MFNSNKYTNWYYSIIKKAMKMNRIKGDGVYYERHHIIPRSLCGDNSKSNLVLANRQRAFCVSSFVDKNGNWRQP